jgi:hypothetical protein
MMLLGNEQMAVVDDKRSARATQKKNIEALKHYKSVEKKRKDRQLGLSSFHIVDGHHPADP